MTRPDELSDDDRARIVAYVDGELDTDDAIDFERRLSEEPELATALDEFVAVDHARRVATATPARWTNAMTWMAAAAAACLVAIFIWTREPPPVEFEVAAVRSDATLTEYHARLGIDPTIVPPGTETRSDPSGRTVTAAEYEDLASSAEERYAQRALESATTTFSAEFFLVALRCQQESAVVLVGIPARGRPARLYPDGAPDPGANRLAPDRIHLLPSPGVRIDPSTADRLRFEPGIALALGVAELHVLVALRSTAIPPEFYGEVDRWLAKVEDGGDRAAVRRDSRRWLSEHGFAVRELRIVEP